ncbi:MAG: BMP family ABC transporter substrate-binding protein [Subdoligranulum sp.]|nr:BMP family ABC transporter substrate-binding protein [Subdoligranulum sp.]MBD5102263.1 BMP family ABC transporter substrate-binding protein [Subdoligranulum sp.]
MSRGETVNQYTKALKQGRKTCSERLTRGEYPYLQILDEILDDRMAAGHVDVGVIEIPMDAIVGTKTEGRRSAFSADFMPLLPPDSEFALKWMALCEAHLSNEGIRDPIHCYEYMGRFYVLEGNKRVSVLRSYGAASISGSVIRVIPAWSDDPGIRAYYEFSESYPLTRLYQTRFTRPGSFLKLQTALGYDPDHVWTEDERRLFASGFARFREAYRKQGGDRLPLAVADALLVWLKVYPFQRLLDAPAAEINKSVATVWPDIRGLLQPEPIAVSIESPEDAAEDADAAEGPGLLGRLLGTRPAKLRIAFLNEYQPDESDWIRAHDLGREYLETVLEDRVTTRAFYGLRTPEQADEAMETAIREGAQVVFATTPSLISACRKAAARHPDVRILNCSVSMPYAGVRTYYSRLYEGKFIAGVIAGALSQSDRIGYVASSPIFGVPASINAFALGAQMTNPRARIELRWSCVEQDPMGAMAKEGLRLICNRDLPTPDRMCEPWGLCAADPDGSLRPLAAPYWHWGNFYVKLVKSMFSGGWDALKSQDGRAVNYWWGMYSRVVGILLADEIPAGIRQLAELLQRDIENGSLRPFHRTIHSQDGTLRTDGGRWFSPEEILHMDWLCDNVDGSIPKFEELLPFARPIVRLQGLDRDHLPPEKEATIL